MQQGRTHDLESLFSLCTVEVWAY